MNATYEASGPGPKTRDGCSVEMYLRLPHRGEVDLFKSKLAPGTSVLELGSGVGRITRKLLESGFQVTAVDNSAEMLEHVPAGARAVCADIEELALEEEFDAVLLASCLINIPDEATRSRQLARALAHLRRDGKLVIERFDPEWLSSVTPGPAGQIGPISLAVLEARHRGMEVDVCLRYSAEDASWLQRFTARILDDDELEHVLALAGFAPPTWIDRRWAVARPRNESH